MLKTYEDDGKKISLEITHLCLRQADAFIWASSSDKHVIRKVPEDSNEENKYPKLSAVHRTQCNMSSTLRFWSMLLLLTLLRCSPCVSVVDIRTLYVKLNGKRKAEKERKKERERERTFSLFGIGGSAHN